MIFLLAAMAAQPVPTGWAAFARAGALSHVKERVEIDSLPRSTGSTLEYRMTYVRQTIDRREHFVATSIGCPAVRSVIASMRDLRMPHPAPYGIAGDSPEIVLDGTTYELEAPTDAAGGRTVINSNIGSSLADWVDGAFRALEPCWKKSD